jgi:hypothetical protein
METLYRKVFRPRKYARRTTWSFDSSFEILGPVMRSISSPSLPSPRDQLNYIDALNTMLRWVFGCADLVLACRAIASVRSDDQSQPLFRLDLVGLLLASYIDRRDSQDDSQHHPELHFDVGLCLLAIRALPGPCGTNTRSSLRNNNMLYEVTYNNVCVTAWSHNARLFSDHNSQTAQNQEVYPKTQQKAQPKAQHKHEQEEPMPGFAKLVFDKSKTKRLLPYFDLAKSTFVQAKSDSDFEFDSHDGV